MQGPYLRKWGTQTTIDFTLFEVDGVDFRVDAAHATSDTVIMKDEGTEVSTSNAFTDEGLGYSQVLTATEMQAARIVVHIVDQSGTKVWLDDSYCVETYGHGSAMHAADLDDSVRLGLTAVPAGGAASASAITALNNLSIAEVAVQATSSITVFGTAQASAIAALNDVAISDLAVQATSSITVFGTAQASAISALENISSATVLAQAVQATIDQGIAQASALSALENLSAGTVLTQAVSALTTQGIAQASAITALASTATIVDAIWDEFLSTHTTVQSVGKVLNDMAEDDGGTYRFTLNALEQAPSGSGASAAVLADAVWDEFISSHTTAQSIGKVLNDMAEDNAGTYRFTSAALAEGPSGGLTQTTVETAVVNALGTYTGAQLSTLTALNNLSIAEVAVQVTSSITVFGTAQASAISALNDISISQVGTQVTSSLTVFGTAQTSAISALENISQTTVETAVGNALRTYTGAQLSTLTALNNVSINDLAVQATSALTVFGVAQASAISALNDISISQMGTQITSSLTVYGTAQGSAITALENLSSGTVLTQAVAALVNQGIAQLSTFTANRAEPGQGAPAASTGTLLKVDYLYKDWRNETETTSTQHSIKNAAGNTVDHKATLSDDGTTFTKGVLGTGP
jgi:hypothetical protein